VALAACPRPTKDGNGRRALLNVGIPGVPGGIFVASTSDHGNISRKDRFYSLEVIHMTFALLRIGLNPFDPKAVLFAKHAQHVVLIHFPIALFITAVAFDLAAHWTKGAGLTQAAYYNLLVAALSTIPVLATGILAWQFQLEGQKLKGILLMHLVLAAVSTALIWLAWWLHFRAQRTSKALPRYRLPIELLGIVVVAVTGHLGGFLSGVNSPG
jgi:uncharacterized membrane protein